MIDAMDVLWACPVLAGGEVLTLSATALSGGVGWDVENPTELVVGVGGSGSSSAPSDFERWSLIAVLNASVLALSFVSWAFRFGLDPCIGLSEGVTNASTEEEAANVASGAGAVSSGLVVGKAREAS
jgi:hypothetical protein